MADPKDKGKGKPKSDGGGGGAPTPWGMIVGVIIGLFLIGQGITLLGDILGFSDPETGALNPRAVNRTKLFFINLIGTLQFISLFISLLFVMGIIYTKFRIHEIKRLKAIKEKARDISDKRLVEKPQPNKKWLKVVEHVSSPNPADWRLAILEADILLNEILDKMGYKGVTIGEKLKSIERSDFDHLNDAWEAHKTRNMIAHEGSEFRLSQSEAKAVIAKYERVFKEFYFI
jgi:hypothetical protein